MRNLFDERSFGEVYMYPNFPAISVEADRAGRKFLVRTQEPAEKGKGVHVLVEIPYSIIPSLMEAVLKSLSDTRE